MKSYNVSFLILRPRKQFCLISIVERFFVVKMSKEMFIMLKNEKRIFGFCKKFLCDDMKRGEQVHLKVQNTTHKACYKMYV